MQSVNQGVAELPASEVVVEMPGAKRARQGRKAPQGSKTKAARKLPTKRIVHLSRSEARTVGQFIAACAAAFLPVASYVLAHYEANGQPLMWALVAAALMFSAPTLAEWAMKWCKGTTKAWGFCLLLEGVMIFSANQWLSMGV